MFPISPTCGSSQCTMYELVQLLKPCLQYTVRPTVIGTREVNYVQYLLKDGGANNGEHNCLSMKLWIYEVG